MPLNLYDQQKRNIANTRMFIAGFVLLLAFAYPLLWTALWETQAWVTRTRRRLALFTLAVLLVPVLTIALGALVS